MSILAALAAPAGAQQTSADTGFTPRLDFGFIDFGVSVASRRPGVGFGAAQETATSLYRLADTEITTADIGLDVRFRWPATYHGTVLPTLQPYVSLGPALAVPVGEDALAISRSGLRPEPAMTLGLRSALGLSWQLSPGASLFGEYRIVQDRSSGRSAGETDLFYGLQLKF
jgi:hypothetical protein